MTPRERWLAVLRKEKPDRVPMDYWATPEATGKLLAHLGCSTTEELFERLHVDEPLKVSAKYIGPELTAGTSAFGVKSKTVDYGAGAYVESISTPLAEYRSVAEIERDYAWPKPDWWDYSELPKQIAGKETRPIQGGGSEPFLVYKQLRGQEQAFVDLIEKPDLVHYCLDKLCNLAYEATRRIYEQIPGKVMISYVAEDLGGQEDLMCSPDQIK